MANPHVAGGKNRQGTAARTKPGVVAKPLADRGGNKKERAKLMKRSQVVGPT